MKCTEQAVLTPIGRSDRKLLWLSSVINRGEPESLKNKKKPKTFEALVNITTFHQSTQLNSHVGYYNPFLFFKAGKNVTMKRLLGPSCPA